MPTPLPQVASLSTSTPHIMEKQSESEQIKEEGPPLNVSHCIQCLEQLHLSMPIQRSQKDTNLSFLWHSRLGHPGTDALTHLP